MLFKNKLMKQIRKILLWLRVAGVKQPKKLKLPEKSRFDFWYKFMLEELEETKKAYEENNLTKVIDGIIDLQWVHANLIHLMGLYGIYQECFDEVAKSNFSKFCKSEQEARLSVESYKSKKIEAYYRKVHNYFVVVRKADEKVLKSINWQEPDFEKIISKQTN